MKYAFWRKTLPKYFQDSKPTIHRPKAKHRSFLIVVCPEIFPKVRLMRKVNETLRLQSLKNNSRETFQFLNTRESARLFQTLSYNEQKIKSHSTSLAIEVAVRLRILKSLD